MKRILMAVAVTAGAVGAGGFWVDIYAADKAEGSTEVFMKAAMEGNLGEIQLGELAQQKGYSQAVRDLGSTLVADHSAANTKAMATAVKLGIAVPTAPTSEVQETIKELKTYNGKDFDVEFIDAVMAKHEDTLELYEEQSKNKDDGAVTLYAREVLPLIQRHAAVAKSLDK